MPTEEPTTHLPPQRILARVAPEDLVGRRDALREIAALSSTRTRGGGLLLLAAPASGVTEILRQAYDLLFARRDGVTPIYFSWSRSDHTAAGAARHFFHHYLSQLVAHRRQDASLVNAPVTLNDLAELAPPADAEWIERAIESYARARAGGDEAALIRFCLSTPQQAAAQHGARTLLLFDDVPAVERLTGETDLWAETARLSANSETPVVYAGLRRRLLHALSGEPDTRHLDGFRTLHVEGLSLRNARHLIERLSRTTGVAVGEETRDLIAQQFAGSPLYITSFLQAAQRRGARLVTFLDAQRLYVDELLGGFIHRRLSALTEEIASAPATRRALLRALHDSLQNPGSKSTAEAWRKRLELTAEELSDLLARLHTHEVLSHNATLIEVNPGAVWRDYLRANFRLQINAEPRALVVAETLTESLKRAPQTLARHYRRDSALGLRDLLARFDGQRVPASLLHFDRYERLYRGLGPEEVAVQLDAETDLVRLPQVVHAASGGSFYPPLFQSLDEERCAVAHGFDANAANGYTDSSEVVWVCVEIESKLEVGRALAEVWYERLRQAARACGFRRVRFWFVSPEGFSADAGEFLNACDVFNSSRRQLEMLTTLVRSDADAAPASPGVSPNEFEMIIPMGDDMEMIAAQAVEQIARRLKFQPEEINQIKTALVEACINATEHSLSPDKKIYQRVRLGDDKLILTVSSRGIVVPSPVPRSPSDGAAGGETGDELPGRRGWGLKLIRALMDEVEYERVDDGTRLRMTKYIRQ
ncbi:MAG: ATP-binding protein [Pyrinomonadaceae bacterium]